MAGWFTNSFQLVGAFTKLTIDIDDTDAIKAISGDHFLSMSYSPP